MSTFYKTLTDIRSDDSELNLVVPYLYYALVIAAVMTLLLGTIKLFVYLYPAALYVIILRLGGPYKTVKFVKFFTHPKVVGKYVITEGTRR